MTGTTALRPTTLLNGLFVHQVPQLLVALRFIGVLLAAALLSILGWFSEPPPPLLWLLPALALVVNLGLWRRVARAPRLANAELCVHIAGDSAVLFVLLWPTGGATNPFVSFFLVPIALASVALPLRFAAAITALCIGAYSVLLARYLAHLPAGGAVFAFERHVIGMWLNFVMAAILLCAFLLILTARLQQREREVGEQRERLLRDEAIMASATVAAGAAHALNTPLGTIMLAAESLADNDRLDAEAQADAATIDTQARLCGDHLKRIAAVNQPSAARTRYPAEFAEELVKRWRARRPDVALAVTGLEALPKSLIRYDAALAQALSNLFDNAADASVAGQNPRVTADWASLGAEPTLRLDLHDAGTDTDVDALNRALTHTTKPAGLGLGLTLARAAIIRLGGRLRFERAGEQPGVRTRIEIPLGCLAGLEPTAG